MAADDDALARRTDGEAVVRIKVEDHAVGICERQQEVRSGDLVKQRLEFGQRQSAHPVRLLAAASELRVADDAHAWRQRQVEARLDAAHPAFDDLRGRAKVARGCRTATAHGAVIDQLPLLG
ncbi:MAG TPA: hypothetical protein VGE16_14645 [Albitalea sp.]